MLTAEGDHVDNDASVAELVQAALAYAGAGADCVAPSDMMDGRIGAIRTRARRAGLERTILMSYAVKFHSTLYGPFRVAADSAPKSGSALKDRASYQLDPARPSDAWLCAERDDQQGADILMVKPGLPYLDLLRELSREIRKPWAVYHVSGEFAALEALAAQGLAAPRRTASGDHDCIPARRGEHDHHLRRALCARVAMRHERAAASRSEELFARARRVSPGGVHSPVRAFRGVGGTPRFMTGGDGATLRDVDGREYLDFCMAFGPLILGHADPQVRRAAEAALARGWSLGTAEPYSLELAELITARMPWVESIRFVNSGTEAVMSALRVARAATSRARRS